jgi:hypothetical protein
MFNPDARMTTMRFADRHVCYVIDDALLDPDQWVRYAGKRSDDFRPLDQKGYPGICLPAPVELTHALDRLFTKILAAEEFVRRHRIEPGYSWRRNII